MTTQRSSRVHVGRVADGRVTVLGAGIAVAPTIVMVPLGLSGPLRPRLGVVVLPAPDAPAVDAIEVLSVVRSEPGTGDVLGLELAEPLDGYETPPTEAVDRWLARRLQARGAIPEGSAADTAETGQAVADSAVPSRHRPPHCVIWPRLCN